MNKLRALVSIVLMSLWAMAQGDTLTLTVQPGEFTIEQALQTARLSRLHGQQGNTTLLL